MHPILEETEKADSEESKMPPRQHATTGESLSPPERRFLRTSGSPKSQRNTESLLEKATKLDANI